MSKGKLQITELEFDSIKTSLRNYLQSQNEFSDYDFEGSGLNVLLDILAYNTHYMSYYNNMIANEMFLDTADLRQSVVSHAKLLGYTPRSATGAIARVNYQITPPNGNTQSVLQVPRFTRIKSENINGTNYTFVTLDDKLITKVDGKFVANNVIVKQGTPVVYTFSVSDDINPKQNFTLPDFNVDTSTIEVTVQTSATNLSTEKYVLAEDASLTTANSAIYFLDEVDGGKYQIYFGDDIIGKKLKDGNIVIVSYLVTDAELANRANVFTMIDYPDGFSNISVTTTQSASGGAPIESIQSVRFTAPKAYIAQNRAVTKNDYITQINKKYPFFDSVTVWGGEENVPPVYGKVFISAKPKDGFEVTEAEKNFIKEVILKPISVLTVIPEYVNADYNFLNFGVNCTYNPSRTNKKPAQVDSVVRTAIQNFVANELNKFNATFRSSRLSRAIDDSDPSILSTELNIFVEKKIRPELNAERKYTFDFGIELARGTTENRLYSTPAFNVYDSEGIIRNCFFEETPSSFSGIDAINIVNPGSGYTETPTVEILGDGTGALAEAVIVNGKVKTINVTRRGSEYTTAVIRITGGGGTSATATAVIQGRTGTIRSFYFDENQIKIIQNENAGTIDYVNGKVTIQDLTILDVLNDLKELSIHAKPEKTVFQSSKNKVITLNSSDPLSIVVTLTPVIE